MKLETVKMRECWIFEEVKSILFPFCKEISASITDSMIDDGLRLGGEKTVCSGFWVQKHAAFAPACQKRLDSRLRSPLPSVEEPCPLSLPYGFFTPKAFA